MGKPRRDHPWRRSFKRKSKKVGAALTICVVCGANVAEGDDCDECGTSWSMRVIYGGMEE